MWRPCLALGYCFCESGFGGGWFFDRIYGINKIGESSGAWMPRAAVGVILSDASISSVLSVSSVSSVVIMFRFFTSFVSFSVIQLSFSSLCYPSVDCGPAASLPGLRLLFYWESEFRGDGGFF